MKLNEPTPLGNLLSTVKKRILTMPPDFDEISLTPEELEYAIYDARCGKYFDERDRKEKAAKARELLDCLTPFTTQQLREYVLQNNPQFQVNEQNEKVFGLLCQYFANDPLFASSGFSLAKGILLSGRVGVGKTEMLKVFNKKKAVLSLDFCF